MIHYCIEKLLLNLALFFLRISYLGKVKKYDTTNYQYYSLWIKEYFKNFKKLIERV